MKGKVAVLLWLCLIITALFAQAPDTMWTRTYGEEAVDCGYCVQQTTDGGYIVAGFTVDHTEDMMLTKTDSLGDILWTSTYDFAMFEDLYCVKETPDGGYIAGGGSASFGIGGGADLIRIDALGNILWHKGYAAFQNHQTIGHFNSVQITGDGGYIAAGNPYVFLVKTDSLGDSLWIKRYGEQPYYGYSVQQTSDSGYIVAGKSPAEEGDVYLIKTDENGDTLWTKTYGGTEDDGGYSVQQTADGGYIIVGYTASFGTGGQDVWLLKTDSNGGTLWTKIYGGTQDDAGHSVQQTVDDGYIITGYTASFGAGGQDVWFLKTDENGDTLWTKTYGGTEDDGGYSVQQTADGGYIIAGYTASFGAGGQDVWLIKTEPDVGVMEWPIVKPVERQVTLGATIFSGPLLLPEGKICRIFDITGRIVAPDKLRPGIYFVEVNGQITQKVAKVK